MPKITGPIVKALLQDIPSLLRPNYARVIPNVIRAAKGTDPLKEFVSVKYPYLNCELYKKPFIIDFSDYLKKFGNIDVEAINSYTVGMPVKKEGTWCCGFYNPLSDFKESWFGAYIVFDDDAGKGKKFMLNDPAGSPEKLDNISTKAMAALTETDQRLVFFSSHNNNAEPLKRDFVFTPGKEKGTTVEKEGASWKSLEVSFATKSVMPDFKTAPMGLFSTIRGYCAIPDPETVPELTPWHDTTMHGQFYSRYVKGKQGRSFWIVVYCCGTEFSLKDGSEINTWTPKLQELYRQMFMELKIEAL